MGSTDLPMDVKKLKSETWEMIFKASKVTAIVLNIRWSEKEKTKSRTKEAKDACNLPEKQMAGMT